MTTLPIFPLESVLLPGLPLALRLFEPRFLALLDRVLADDGSFGVVLIERGSEVGGGDQRFGVGTLARIADVSVREGWVAVSAWGDSRFEVVEWLPDDPYPLARVRVLPPLVWSGDLAPRFAATERAVRRALAVVSEFAETRWPASVELADDPLAAVWQLAGIAPVSALDHVALLRSTTAADLLDRTAALAAEAADLAQFSAGPDGERPDA